MSTTNRNPYIGPRTFQRNESHLFFGRDREVRDLTAFVITEKLVLFYAQSGAGKSSLINTSLIPELERNLYEVLPVGRVIGDMPENIQVENIYVYNLVRSLIRHEIDAASVAQLTLPQFMGRLNEDEAGYFYDSTLKAEIRGPAVKTPWRRVLIIDQFEEVFSTNVNAWSKREDFFRQLAQAMQADPYLWVILVMREDYIAALDPYAHLVPGGLSIRYYMQRLSREAAIKAVKGPVETIRPYVAGVAEKLVEDLSRIKFLKPDGTMGSQDGQYIEPVQLQVVCFGLWENLVGKDLAEGSTGTAITLEDVQDVGDVNQSLEKHYARRVKEVADRFRVNERDIRDWFGNKLITAGGIRNLVLRTLTNKAGELADEVIQALQSDLVRAEPRVGAIFYELTHDRLVEPIINNNREWQLNNSSYFHGQAIAWMESGRKEIHLLSDAALSQANLWAKENQDKLTRTDQEFLEAGEKRQAEAQRLEAERLDAEHARAEQERKLQAQQLESAQKEAEAARKLAAEQERFAREQARSAKQARLLTRIALSLFALAIIASVFAGSKGVTAQNNANIAATSEAIAETEKKKADDLAKTARARELASRADEAMDNSMDLSMLLSVEAFNITDKNRDAQNAIFDNGQRSTRLRGFLASSINPASQFRFNPDGKFLAAVKRNGKKENLVLWNLDEDLGNGRVLDSSGVSQFFFSPDNKFLIYLTQDGINFWDLEKQEKNDPINQHIGKVTQVVYPDNRTFVTLGENGDVTQWDATKSQSLSTAIRGNVISFSPHGSQFAKFELDKIMVRNIAKSNQPAFPPIDIDRDPYSVTSMAFSQDEKFLAIADRDGNIDFWDLEQNKETGNVITITPFPPGTRIEKMAFHPNGNLAVFINYSGNNKDGIEIFDGKSSKQIIDLIPAQDVRFSPDGNTLAALALNLDSGVIITLYGMASGNKINENSLIGTPTVFSWDGQSMAVFNKDGNKISLIDVSSGNQVGELSDQTSEQTSPAPIVSMAFSGDGNFLTAGFEDGSITTWDVNSRNITNNDKSSTSPVSSLAFSPDGKQLIAGREDSQISILDMSKPEPAPAVSKPTSYLGYISSIGLSPDGKFLYSIANDGVDLIDMNEVAFLDKKLKTLTSVSEILPGNNLKFIDNDEILWVSNNKSMIVLWDISSKQIIGRLQGDFSQFDSGAFALFSSPEQRVMETIDKDKKVTFWNTVKGTKLSITQDSTATYKLYDNFVISLNKDNLINLFFDVPTGASKEKLKGQKYIGLDPKENILVTSNTAGQFELWGTSTGEPLGKPIQVITGQNPPPYYFSPSGNILITSSVSGKFDLWNTRNGESLGVSIDGGGAISYNQQDGTPQYVLFNKDETRLITRTDNSGTNIWDLSTMKKIGESLAGNYDNISQDNHTLVVVNISGVSLWDFESGKLIGEQHIEGNYSYDLPRSVFSSDGQTLAIILSDKKGRHVALWNMVKMKLIGPPIDGTYVDMSLDGKTLMLRNSRNEITFWDTANSNQIGSPILGVSGPIIGNAIFNPKGNIQSVRNEGSDKEASTVGLLGGEKSFDQNSEENLVMSPDENTFAILTSDGSLTLWYVHLPTMPENTIMDFKDFADTITSVVPSPDGNTLAAASKDGITLWNIANDPVIRKLQNKHIIGTADLYVDPKHKTLVAKTSDGNIFVWDIGTGKQKSDSIHEAFCGFSPDGRILVTATSSNTYTYPTSSPYSYSSYCSGNSNSVYTLWDTFSDSDQPIKPIGDRLIGYYYSFTKDGRFMMFQSRSDFIILKIDTKGRSVDSTPVGEPIPGSFQSFAANGKWVISNESDNFKLWETDSELEKRVVKSTFSIPKSSGSYAHARITTPEGKGALIYVYDYRSGTYTYYLWDLKTLHPIMSPIKNLTDSPVISPDGVYMAGSTDKGMFTIWNLTNEEKSNPIPGKPSRFSPDDNYIAVIDDSGDVPVTRIVLLADTGKNIDGHFNGSFFNGSFWGFSSPNGEAIVFNDGKKGGFILYNTVGGTPINQTAIPGNNLMFSPDGQFFASYYTAGGISLRRTSTAGVIDSNSKSEKLIGFSADSKTMVTTITKEGISYFSLWDTATGNLRSDPFPYPGSLTGIRMSEDRNILFVFGNESTFSWDLIEPYNRKPIANAVGEANQIIFSPGGKTLATKGNDGIILWNLSGPEPIASSLLIGSTGYIADFSFKDEKTLVYVDVDGSFFKYDLATNKVLSDSEKPPKIPGTACRIHFSPNGEYLAYKSGNKLYVGNVDGSEFTDLGENKNNISCLGPMVFSENGDSLAYSEGNHVYITGFDKSGKITKKVDLIGDTDVSDLTFVRDDILAATGKDGRIYLWDVGSRTLFGVFNQSGIVTRITKDRLQIYLLSERRLIQIDLEDDAWKRLLKTWQADLCDKLESRFLTKDEWQQYFPDSGYPDNPACPMPTMVSGHLYYDANGNGTQDGNELNLSNVDVEITPSSGAAFMVTTDTDGNWFATVPPGNTISEVQEKDSDWTQTEGTDPTTVTAVAGVTFSDNDGFYTPSTKPQSNNKP